METNMFESEPTKVSESAPQDQGDGLLNTKPDPYFNTRLVHSLNESNFGGFLWTKDAALVMFYNPCDSMSSVFKKDFAMAAGSTKRANHAFAAVNCDQQKQLCRVHDVFNTPTFVLFSKGNYVGSVKEVSKFRANSLRQYVETTSVP
ncbi:unnamed protein product [Candidula unifasciata]|uniref:Thioredoxin domain-containing protein n=1 Tax=Candidula unifasciata TaxID=100452 RepID=A0A8S4A7R7_9EUPU|nr:unnamed protein product [Candidula unifasciata]